MAKIRIALLTLAFVSAAVGVAADTAGAWIDVPYVAQARDGCGSAAISMVLQYWSAQLGQPPSSRADPREIQDLLFSPAEKGIPAGAMQKYFEDSGYHAYAFRGDAGDLRHQVSQGRPTIVSLRASGARGPLHYAVVVGVDWQQGYVFLHDPARGKMFRLPEKEFQTEWRLANDWLLLVVPRAGG